MPLRLFLILFLLLGVIVANAAERDLPGIVREVGPSVLRLVTFDAEGKKMGSGSGFFVTETGVIATNEHVLKGASRVDAEPAEGPAYTIRGVLVSSTTQDLALLQAEASGVPYLRLAADSNLEVGSKVVVIGSPRGFSGTVSEGILSAHRSIGEEKLLQITAPISQGSSGSPVLNEKGEVIGIATMLIREAQALNFAAPVEGLRALMKQIVPADPVKPISGFRTEKSQAYRTDADYQAAISAQFFGETLTALKLLKSVRNRYPDVAHVHFALGQAYGNLKFYREACESYADAVKIDPEFACAWNNLGVTLGREGSTHAAIKAYQQAIKSQPHFPLAWRNLALAYRAIGKRAEAAEAEKWAKQADDDEAFEAVTRQEGSWMVYTTAGREYVTFDEVAKFYELGSVTGGPGSRFASSKSRSLRMTPKDRIYYVNNLAFEMAEPPIVYKGKLLVRRSVISSLVEPVMRPGKITGLVAVSTIIIDPDTPVKKTGSKGSREAALTQAFAIASETATKLTSLGYDVKLTRENAKSAPDPKRYRDLASHAGALWIAIDVVPEPDEGPFVRTTSNVSLDVMKHADGNGSSGADDHRVINAYSMALGTAAHAALVIRTRFTDEAIRSTPTERLRGIQMPAVLITLGATTTIGRDANLVAKTFASAMDNSVRNFVIATNLSHPEPKQSTSNK